MPIELACDACGAAYTLKDEFAGRKVRCQSCEQVLIVPAAPAALHVEAGPAVDRGYHASFDRDRFLVNQKRISISEKYFIFDEEKRPILFVERPARLGRQLLALFGAAFAILGGILVSGLVGAGIEQAVGPNSPVAGIALFVGIIATFIGGIALAVKLSPKRHITIYADESKTEPLLEALQDQKLQFLRATYTVREPGGDTLGRMKKNYLYNLFRKRWYVLGPDDSVRLLAKEDSLILSLLRRLLGTFFGILRANYIIVVPGEDRVIGEFNRKFTLFDRYVLDMSGDREHRLDRRLAVALAILLDTGERR